MAKAFYIFILAFLLLVVADVWTLRDRPVDQSIDQLENYCEQQLDYFKSQVLSDTFLTLLTADSLNRPQLQRIRHFDSTFKKNKLNITMLQNDSLIYWTSDNLRKSYCKSYKKHEYKVQLCIDPFDKQGNLEELFYEKTQLHHQISLATEGQDSSLIWQDMSLSVKNNYRPVRLNNIFLLLYIVILFVIIAYLIQKSKLWSFASVLVIKLLLTLLPNWKNRFSNSDLITELFGWQTYSNVDLLLDSFLLFMLALWISRSISQWIMSKSSLPIVLSLGVLQILLILTHLRLVQYIALSDQFNITINDISSINTAEIIVILSLLIALAGIFVFTVSYIQYLKKSLSAKVFYLSLFVMIVLTLLGVITLNLSISALYCILFLICYYVLTDLFIDINQKSITWIIWWSIFFGIYMSSLFFNYDIQKQLNNRQAFLETLLEDTTEDELINTPQLDSVLFELNQIITLPNTTAYDESDLEHFFEDKYKLQGLNINISDLDNSPYKIFEQNSNYLQRVQKDRFFDPVSNYIWKIATTNDSTFIWAGYELKAPSEISYPVILYANKEFYNEGQKIGDDELQFMKNMDRDLASLDGKIYLRYKKGDLSAYTTKEFESLIKPIALFSLLFTCIILLFVGIGWINKYLALMPVEWPLNSSNFESLNARIQTALILVILLSFIFIAAVTSSFLGNFIDAKNDIILEEKIETVVRDIARKLRHAESPQEAIVIANNYKKEIESTHNAKLRIIDFNKQNLTEDYFNYVYFNKQKSTYPYTVKLKNNNYKSYIPVKYRGKSSGFVEMSVSSESTKAFNIYDFLGSIFNVYVFLFLIASVISIFIAKSITKPLSILNQKMNDLRLGKQNELISWEREDEMGKLIHNYNNMVQQLEDSAEILAKTERDNAWREMAKQVAHEIKNPLTPMKMYIQHLEKAIKQSPDRAHEIAKKISSTLLEQVENLTQIADSFSNFAELPQSSNEKIEINKVVELVHNLFRKRDDMEIVLSEPIDPLFVYADKNQLIRILNNLVKNAIESIPPDRKGKISLSLSQKGDKAIISVEDNGTGIPENMYEKVFQPKFTTKDSGSGLGLAIALNMIESMNGRLYFKSVYGTGTRFFIELDILRQNFEESDKRITLD